MHCKRAQRMKQSFSKTIMKTPDSELTPKSLTCKTINECFREGHRNAKQKVKKNFLNIM